MTQGNKTAALEAIIVAGETKQLVITAKDLGQELVRVDLKTSQIRNIFGTARKIQAIWFSRRRDALHQLMLLQPKLEYQSMREQAVLPLKEWLIPAIDLVYDAKDDKDEEEVNRRFTRFMDFFEATLAYHTAKGGKQDKGSR